MNPNDLNLLRQRIEKLDQMQRDGLLSETLHQESRQALERELVAAVLAAPAVATAAPRAGLRTWLLVGAVVAGLGGAGYWWSGSAEAGWSGMQTGLTPSATAASAPHALGNEQMAAMVQSLAERLKTSPDDAEGWGMLARSYATLGRPAEALPAYERALKLAPKDAQLMADYADTLALQQGRQLSGAPMEWIRKALQMDPRQPKALLLAGTEAFNRQDYAAALKHWEAVVQGGVGGNLVEQARAGVEDARQALGQPAAASAALPGLAGARVTGQVSLAPALLKQVQPDDTVFVFARPAQGARMPLAMLRKQVKDLPLSFVLDDSLAMSPQARLSSAREVVVSARISRSGQAQPQPGDLEGSTAAVAVGSEQLKLVIATPVK
ncbi:tetratricopeptide repeat protein [Paucibacter sp. JuS9]|uniref:tetratricopeptide repeat protein n=1 Tax=Paucibacter sp. JuS9 TaxID=3228748 RepID=UPI0037571FD7